MTKVKLCNAKLFKVYILPFQSKVQTSECLASKSRVASRVRETEREKLHILKILAVL